MDRLRIGSHNVANQLGSRLNDFVSCWLVEPHLRLDIVLVQETHMSPDCVGAYERRLHDACAALCLSPFRCYWAHCRTGRQAGVGILIREEKLRGGSAIHEDSLLCSPCGRLVAIDVTWRGHELTLVSAYAPCLSTTDNNAAQAEFFSTTLPAFLASIPAERSVVMGGDFNVTLHPPLERVSTAQAAAAAAQARAESRGGTALQLTCHDSQLQDAYRALHPTTRRYSYLKHGAAALLDRIFVASALLPAVRQCKVVETAPRLSDHRAVYLDLAPTTARPANQRPPNCRVDSMADRAVHQQYCTWLRGQVALAPADDAALLQWWPDFSARVAAHLRGLQRAYVTSLRSSSAAREAHMARVSAAAAALQRLPVDAPPAAVTAALRALQDLARGAPPEPGLPEAAQRRAAQVHAGETPSPALTAFLKPRRVPRLLCLRVGHQRVTDPNAIAEAAVTHFSSVSAQPQCCPDARQTVLQHMRAHATPLAAEHVTALAQAEVTQAEVAAALQSMRANRAPGPDALPAEVWKLRAPGDADLPPEEQEGPILAPLLARLFTAIGRLQATPAGFLDGRVVALFKDGEPTLISNYRPITLLNTVHRVLAKVLVARLAPALAAAIGQEQSAFLPGRQIGERVLALLLLQDLLAGEDDAGIAFLDISKAYDTVSRDFLYEALDAVQAAAFVPWVRTLLTGTQAVVDVNGVLSLPRQWHAGVPQGSPLSPLLYLLVSWALSCHLLATPGLTPRGLPAGCHCGQYADDTHIPLARLTPQCVGRLVAALGVFGRATGQTINYTKSKLLSLGSGAPTEGRLAGIPIHTSVKVLGITISRPSPAQPSPASAAQALAAEQQYWHPLLRKAIRAFQRLACMGMSTAGRGLVASAYGVSTLLYHAEFLGAPDWVLAQLRRSAAAVVDRRQPPALPEEAAAGARPAQGHRRRYPLPGIPTTLLFGNPRQGAFGLLPYEENVTARQAVWGLRLLHHLLPAQAPAQQPATAEAALPDPALAPEQPPLSRAPAWLALATRWLRRAWPGQDPALALVAAVVHAQRLDGQAPAPLPPRPLDAAVNLPAVLRRLLRSMAAMGPFHATDEEAAAAAEDIPGRAGLRALLSQSHWRSDEPWDADEDEAAATARACKVPILGTLPTVRTLTRIQLGTGVWERRRAQGRFVTLAIDPATPAWFGLPEGVPPADQAPTHPRTHPQLCRHVRTQLGALWEVPLSNRVKDTYWRLTVLGVSGAGGHGICPKGPCACGVQVLQPGDRCNTDVCKHVGGPLMHAHAFWECPVAHAVLTQLRAALPPATPLHRSHLWLCIPPAPAICDAVWRVVCMTAVHAMEKGRRTAWSVLRSLPGGQPDAVPPAAADARALALAAASRAAASEFWSCLGRFVAARATATRPWKGVEDLTADHAFIAVDPARPWGFQLTLPPAAAGLVDEEEEGA